MSANDQNDENEAAFIDAFFLPSGILDPEECNSIPQSLSSSMDDGTASRGLQASQIPSNPWSSTSSSSNRSHITPSVSRIVPASSTTPPTLLNETPPQHQTMDKKGYDKQTSVSPYGQHNESVADVSLSPCHKETVGISSSRDSLLRSNRQVPSNRNPLPALSSVSTTYQTKSSKSNEGRVQYNNKKDHVFPKNVPMESCNRSTQQKDSKQGLAADYVPLRNVTKQTPKQSVRGVRQQTRPEGDSKTRPKPTTITQPSHRRVQRSHDDGSNTQGSHPVRTEAVAEATSSRDQTVHEMGVITADHSPEDGLSIDSSSELSETHSHASESNGSQDSTEPQHCNQQTRNNVSGEHSTATTVARHTKQVRQPCSTDASPRSNVVRTILDRMVHLLSSGRFFLRDRCCQICQASTDCWSSILQLMRMTRTCLVNAKDLFNSLLAQLIALCTIVLLCCAKVLVLLGSIAVQMCKFSLWEAVEEPKVATCYAMFYFVPTFCTFLMDIIDLPHWTPHLASMLAVLSFCSLLEPGPLYTEDTVKWGDVLQLTPRRSLKAHTKPPLQGSRDSDVPRDVESCITILKFLPRLLPLFFLVDGFSTECGTMIGLLGTNRLTTAFMMSMVRKKLVSSPVAWISWALQILVATYHSSFVLVDVIVLILGLSSIRWIRYLEDRRMKRQTGKRF